MPTTIPSVYRAPSAPERTFAQWRKDLAEAERLGSRVRHGRIQGLFMVSLACLGLSRLLDGGAFVLFLGSAGPPPWRVAGHAMGLAVGLFCLLVVAGWAWWVHPGLRVDREDLAARVAALRAGWDLVPQDPSFAAVALAPRLARLGLIAGLSSFAPPCAPRPKGLP